MKNKFGYSLLLFLACIFISACEDFIEVELGGKSVTVLAPANNTVSSNFNQLFKWEALKGADKYQLQIVKPGFSSIQQFVLDTTTAATQFSYSLLSGEYQWRIRGINNSSESEYVTYNLTIDSTQDLSFSSVDVIGLADNYYSKEMTNTFSWNLLSYADNYVFQISGPVNTIQSTTVTTVNYTFPAQGVYQWKVYAQNSFSNSAIVTRTITIDTAAPDVPVALSPITDTITADPVPLEWSTSSSADFSHLLISAPNDSLFSGSATVDIIIPKTGLVMNYNFSTAVVGVNYFWKVQDIDMAGNKSLYFIRKKIRRN